MSAAIEERFMERQRRFCFELLAVLGGLSASFLSPSAALAQTTPVVPPSSEDEILVTGVRDQLKAAEVLLEVQEEQVSDARDEVASTQDVTEEFAAYGQRVGSVHRGLAQPRRRADSRPPAGRAG